MLNCPKSVVPFLPFRTLWRHQYNLASSGVAENAKTAPFCVGRVVVAHSLPVATCTCIGTILGIEKQTQHANQRATDGPLFQILVLTAWSSPEAETLDEDSRKRHIRKLISSTKDSGRSKTSASVKIKVVSTELNACVQRYSQV